MRDGCAFCKIVKGEIPSYKIWEDEDHIAFLSIYPNTEGFTIVATKKHLNSYIFENDDEVVKKLIIATKKVAKLLDGVFEDVARCGVFFEGYGVDHLHSKLYPMHGTADLEKWKQIESHEPTYFDKYPGYLSSASGKLAKTKDLKKVLDKIKKSFK